MNDETDVRFEPDAIELTNECGDDNGFMPCVNVYFPDASVGLITSPERYGTQAQALLRALAIADAQRERITTRYHEWAV